jgi:hypothetical protein
MREGSAAARSSELVSCAATPCHFKRELGYLHRRRLFQEVFFPTLSASAAALHRASPDPDDGTGVIDRYVSRSQTDGVTRETYII